MQTFLPSESYEETASILDPKRLGKQRVETLQIMGNLVGNKTVIDYYLVDVVPEMIEEEPGIWVEGPSVKKMPLPSDQWYIKERESKGWEHHPAVLMWSGYEYSLLKYQFAICNEWHTFRGFYDTCLRKTIMLYWSNPWLHENKDSDPWWLGDPGFHIGHQSNLLRKDPEYYRPLFAPGLRDDLPYYWPADI